MKKQDSKDRMHERSGIDSKGQIASRGIYRNEVEKPEIPSTRENEPMDNLNDFKRVSMDIAYGQAGKSGVESDAKKLKSQFKNYGWDVNTGY